VSYCAKQFTLRVAGRLLPVARRADPIKVLIRATLLRGDARAVDDLQFVDTVTRSKGQLRVRLARNV